MITGKSPAYVLTDDTKYESLMATGKVAADSLIEMVEALECDYDRLGELKSERADWLSENPGNYLEPNDPRAAAGAHWALAYPDESEELAELIAAAGECESREEALERIYEDPLSIEVRSAWTSLGEPLSADEFCILLTTGGPAVRIVGQLDNGSPSRPRLEVQDWGTPWTEYRAIEESVLESYCNCFYFGE